MPSLKWIVLQLGETVLAIALVIAIFAIVRAVMEIVFRGVIILKAPDMIKGSDLFSMLSRYPVTTVVILFLAAAAAVYSIAG